MQASSLLLTSLSFLSGINYDLRSYGRVMLVKLNNTIPGPRSESLYSYNYITASFSYKIACAFASFLQSILLKAVETCMCNILEQSYYSL